MNMLTHNTDTSGGGAAPVIIEQPEAFPFRPGERDEYHPTTHDEYDRYVAYWNGQYDDGEAER